MWTVYTAIERVASGSALRTRSTTPPADELERFASADGLPAGGVTSHSSRPGTAKSGSARTAVASLDLSPAEFQRFAARDGLSDDAVTTLLEDQEGSLWVGTRHGGLNRFREPILPIYTHAPGTLRQRGLVGLWRPAAGTVDRDPERRSRPVPGRALHHLTRPRTDSPATPCMPRLQTSDGTLWVATGRVSPGCATVAGRVWLARDHSHGTGYRPFWRTGPARCGSAGMMVSIGGRTAGCTTTPGGDRWSRRGVRTIGEDREGNRVDRHSRPVA